MKLCECVCDYNRIVITCKTTANVVRNEMKIYRFFEKQKDHHVLDLIIIIIVVVDISKFHSQDQASASYPEQQ